MALLPKFKKINNTQELDVFASTYTQCSGFNVNRDYYENNQVFAIYWQERMVAGLILWYKFKRTLKIVNQRNRVQVNFSKPERQDFFTKAEAV